MELLAALGALSGVISAAYNIIQYHLPNEQWLDRITESERESVRLFQSDLETIAALDVIDKTTRKTLEGKLREILDELHRNIRKSNESGQIGQATTMATDRACEVLRTIKRLNGDVLPSERLRKMWEQFRCF